MYSMIIFNSTILYIWKLLREYILKVLIIKKHWNYVWRWMLNKLIVVFILQYIHTSNVYVAYLKLAQCYKSIRASLVAQRLKHLPGMQETWVRSLGREDSPGEGKWQPIPVLLPGESHGGRSLVGCRPWGHEESDTIERLHFHFSLSCIGEGNGNPLQCSCLENPRDGGAWWAAVYGVTQSWTRLKWLSSSSSTSWCI